MTVHSSAKRLLSALRVERATPPGTPEQARTNQAASELAAHLLDMDRLVALVHSRAQLRRGDA